MPGVDGIAAMRAIRSSVPAPRVVVLTSFLEEDPLLPAIQAGACGFLLKNVSPASWRARSMQPIGERR